MILFFGIVAVFSMLVAFVDHKQETRKTALSCFMASTIAMTVIHIANLLC